MHTRLLKRLDTAHVAVLLVILIASLPLLTRAGLPRHTDLELHVFRAAEFQRVWAERPFAYPRWAPDFYYGYGYPIFNYYAPLTYLAASVIACAPGLSVVAAMKIVLVLTFVLVAFGVFFLARRHFGAVAGVLASAVYVLSPYVAFIDPFMRGDAAEFLALGILPWVFLAFDRPLVSTRDAGFASLALAALVFSHNLIALMGGGLLIAWLLWRGLFVDGVGRWLRDGAAIALAAGLTAVFWLPFLAERDAIRLDVAGPGHFDFRNHFVDLATLLRPSPALDLGATTPHFIYNLGLAQWLLALPALLALRSPRRARARIAVFFLFASAGLIFLITPASRDLWEAIPPAAFIQFPWRFLGLAAFTLAMCAAYVVSTLPRPRIASGVALGVVLVAALPTLYPPLWAADFGDTSPRGMIEFELSGVALGTTSTGDFLPRSVAQLPAPAEPLLDAYRNGRVVDRFDYASAPADATVTPIRLSDLDAAYSVASAGEFTARFFLFDFPGWQAYVDDRPVPIRPSPGDGLIRFELPASARTLSIRFEATPPRTVGGIVSLAAGLATVALVLNRAPRASQPEARGVGSGPAGHLAVVLIVFLALRMLVFDRCDTCFRYTSPPGQALAAETMQQANFANHIELLGFDLPQPEVASGDVLPLTVYWRATAPVPVNYQVFAHLTRPPFILWGQSDKLNPGDFPTTRWPRDKYVWDDHVIRVLPGTPPGEYQLVVGLYLLGSGQRAPVLDATGIPVGDSVQLSLPVRVVRPFAPPPVAALGVQTPIDARVGDLKLLGAAIEQTQLAAPNFVRFTLFWQSTVDAPASLTVDAQLVDGAGHVAAQLQSTPAGGAYPTAAWQAGEIVRDIQAFWLPADALPGVYDISLQITDASGELMDLTIGQVEVMAP